jgi:hypothetical protein
LFALVVLRSNADDTFVFSSLSLSSLRACVHSYNNK